MPSAAQLEMMFHDLLYMILPALLMAAAVMAIVVWLGGVKQSAAGAALALMGGAICGLAGRDAGPLLVDGKAESAWSVLPHILTLTSGESSWNRMPWAMLAALCVGRLAYLSDVHASDGWLLRGGVAIGIAWWLLPETARDATTWLAPAFAAVMWLTWVLLDYLAAQPGSSSVAGGLVLALLTAGTVLLYAASKRLTDPAIVVAMALVGLWLVGYLRGVELGGVMPALAVVLPGLMLMGYLTTEKVHWNAFALTASAPFTLLLTLPFLHGAKWRLHLLRLMLVLIPLVIAVLVAQEAGPLPVGDEFE